jgi:hypothetical protein
MFFQRNPAEQPFMFWLIQELFAKDEGLEEETMPISNREFYTMMALLVGSLLAYGVIFHSFAA